MKFFVLFFNLPGGRNVKGMVLVGLHTFLIRLWKITLELALVKQKRLAFNSEVKGIWTDKGPNCSGCIWTLPDPLISAQKVRCLWDTVLSRGTIRTVAYTKNHTIFAKEYWGRMNEELLLCNFIQCYNNILYFPIWIQYTNPLVTKL